MVSFVFSLFSRCFCWCMDNTNAQMHKYTTRIFIHTLHGNLRIIWGHCCRWRQQVEFGEGVKAHQEVSSPQKNPPWWPTHHLGHGFALNALRRTKAISGAWARIVITWSRVACSTPLSSPPLISRCPTAAALPLLLPWITLLLLLHVGMGRGRHQRSPPSSTRVSSACGETNAATSITKLSC